MPGRTARGLESVHSASGLTHKEPLQTDVAPRGLAKQRVPLPGGKRAPFSGEMQPGQDPRLGAWRPLELGLSVAHPGSYRTA